MESTKGADKPRETKGMPGTGLTGVARGQVAPDKLTLEPYWGKPAVRNLRGARGNGARSSLHGHEAGNGGHSQAQTYGHRASRLPDWRAQSADRGELVGNDAVTSYLYKLAALEILPARQA